MTRSHNAVIVDALRTPVGRYGGGLRHVRPDDLSAIVIRALVARTGIAPDSINDVLWGCANQAGEDNRNVGRMGAILAGLPHSVPGATINRLCASSLDAIIQAARAVWSGDAEIIVAGGVESMSRAPYSIPKNQSGNFGNVTAYDTALGWRYPNPLMQEVFPLESMGETAENVAEKYGISRAEQDAFALQSHAKAVSAQREGCFADELVPVRSTPSQGEAVLIDRDEGPRADTSLEKLAALPPAFRPNGTVSAGNSSSLNDGAAAVLVMNEERARALGIRPLVRVVATGVAGVDPRFMGIGPVPATQKALSKAGLWIDDLDLIELNEAFASQSIAVVRDLKIKLDRLNPHGGAIALGHPLGCSGARIMTTLVHEMKRRFSGSARPGYGLATMCVGVGQGVSVIVESLS
jgi:acetyl-CoA acyltransferase